MANIKKILLKHPAFFVRTKLEDLAQIYNAKIIFCPKYHCELNPIEGLWCYQKQFIRKRTDQTYKSLLKFYKESREEFERENLYMKLIRRFWRCLLAYNQGQDYAHVIKEFFSNKSKAKNKQHLIISNANI